MPRSNPATKLLQDFRRYDSDRDKTMRKLERTLEKTLSDLRALTGAPVKRRTYRRRKAATAPTRVRRVA